MTVSLILRLIFYFSIKEGFVSIRKVRICLIPNLYTRDLDVKILFNSYQSGILKEIQNSTLLTPDHATTMPRLVLGPTYLPIQWVLGPISQEVEWLGCEAGRLVPSGTEVKNARSCASTPPYVVFMPWCLIKHRDFTFASGWL
jgi:hypothetical protein